MGYIVVGRMEGCVRLYDVRTQSAAMTLTGHGSAALCAKWALNNEYELWTSGTNGDIITWDVRSPIPRHMRRYALRRGVLEEAKASHTLVHMKSVTYFEFSCDMSTAYTVDEDGTIKSWLLRQNKDAPSDSTDGGISLADTGVVFPKLRGSRAFAGRGLTLDRFGVSTDNSRIFAPIRESVAVIETSSFVTTHIN